MSSKTEGPPLPPFELGQVVWFDYLHLDQAERVGSEPDADGRFRYHVKGKCRPLLIFRSDYQKQRFLKYEHLEGASRVSTTPDLDGHHTYEVKPRRLYWVMKMTSQGKGDDGKIKKDMFPMPSKAGFGPNSYVFLKPTFYPHSLACDNREIRRLDTPLFNTIQHLAGKVAQGFPLERFADNATTHDGHGRGKRK